MNTVLFIVGSVIIGSVYALTVLGNDKDYYYSNNGSSKKNRPRSKDYGKLLKSLKKGEVK